MTLWLLLNSLALVLQGIVLYLVLRQIGFVLRRVTPVGARGTPEGPRIGENLAHHVPQIADGEFRAKAKLIVFVSNECSICKVIREDAVALARAWSRDAAIWLVYDCSDEGDASVLTRLSSGLHEMRSFHMRRDLGVTFVPFAIVVDRSGSVAGKGLVNEIGHMESLLELERSRAMEKTPSIAASVDALTG
jgi:hypothetical protein